MTELLHEYIFSGSLKQGGSWGGPECASYIDNNVALIENTIWTMGTYFFMYKYDSWGVILRLMDIVDMKRKSLIANRPMYQFIFDRTLGALMVTIFMFLVYYKYNVKALCVLLTPCHLICLTQGLALLGDGGTSMALSMLQYPIMSHTLALAFPDTTGLDQPLEEPMYWYQHYLSAVVPLYLLVRNDYAGLSVFEGAGRTVWTAFCAFIVIFHFAFYAPFDLLFQVNIQFMLCPGAGMHAPLGLAPQWLLWPSYRSILSIVSCVLSLIYTLILVGAAKLIRTVIGGQSSLSGAVTGSSTKAEDNRMKGV